jgi:hypothetical protein
MSRVGLGEADYRIESNNDQVMVLEVELEKGKSKE